MKRRVPSEKGGFAPNSGSALPPSRAGRGLIVNSRVTDWGWGNASSVWAKTPFFGGELMQTAVPAGAEAILRLFCCDKTLRSSSLRSGCWNWCMFCDAF
ncbi:transmembrane protein 258 [Columba livia]|uniref:Transmembrane protein 258 n=1 Tax=Columba livia TaxID=8932 RepID=A0A2I0LL98_COLLI|nr:transmembrane protein 258 [Columba livia]